MKTIRLDGVVGWDILAADVSAQIKGQSSVRLIINSGGGDVLEGFSIYNALKDFDGSIDVQIDFAGSMASVFAMAGDNITMKDNSSILMIHRPWGGAGGNSEDFRKQADTLDKMEAMMLGIYADRSGMDREKISALLEDETYMNAQEAKDFGFIDSIESGKSDFAMVAMAGMRSQEKVNFSTDKFLAKIESMKAEKPAIKNLFDSCACLADVEAVMRNEIKLSRSEAVAITAAVKKQVRGDHELQEVKSIFDNFKL
jgi:ATP-dependent Clp endopeptidase proteolytic subunit ClpP